MTIVNVKVTSSKKHENTIRGGCSTNGGVDCHPRASSTKHSLKIAKQNKETENPSSATLTFTTTPLLLIFEAHGNCSSSHAL